MDYKPPTLSPISYDSYEKIRVHLRPALSHISLKGLRPAQVQ